MKLGTENKRKTIAAAVLAVVALILVARMVSAPSSSNASPSRPKTPSVTVAGNGAPTTATTGARTKRRDDQKILAMPLKPTLDPRLRLDLLKSSEQMKYEGTGRNIFLEQAPEIPQPVAPPRKDIAQQQQQQLQQQGPPPPPPINLKFFGYASRTGERKSIFLSQGDNIFAAHEGDIIGGRYRILHINSTSVEIQDVLSNNTQTIPLTRG